MSPIIYTPHQCKTPTPPPTPRPDLIGTLWQCETCQAIHEAIDETLGHWYKIADPHRKHSIEDASRRVPAEPAPTITPGMVALAIDTYEAHMSVFPTDGSGPNGVLGYCGECDFPIGPHTIKAHALETAAAALTAELTDQEH